MRGTPPIKRRPVTEALRASIVEDLPEINDIQDAELRAKVIEGWAFSLAGSSYQRISDMPGEGNPDVMVLKRGDQSVHLRGVAHFAMKMVEEFAASHPEIRVDRDIVLAGALCHDIGKPYEFDPVNRKRWAEDPSRAGDPCLRHSVYGAHVCLSVGLPEEIAHIALGHSLEGQHIGPEHRVLYRAPRRPQLVARGGRARPAQARVADHRRPDDAAARARCAETGYAGRVVRG